MKKENKTSLKIKGVDKIFCINLKKRTDRKKLAENEFSKFGLDFEFFEGVDGQLINLKYRIKPGGVGCLLSHLNLYKYIKNIDGDVFMITEDDVVFSDDFIEKYNNLIQIVPNDWNLLYFGGNHNSLKLNMVSENIHRLQKTYTTHCYLVKKSCIDFLISEFESSQLFDSEVDVHLSNVQSKIPCYGFTPSIAWQREGFSDIEMRNVDYNFLK
jgi:GR25 family glycosyltransferase involved in LPS biosynthesis